MKCRPHNLCLPSDGTFVKDWGYRCDHDIRLCAEKGFFDNVTDNLMAGDRIRCVEYLEGEAVAEMFVFVRAKGQRMVSTGASEVVRYDTTPSDVDKPEAIPVTRPPKFIQGDGEVKWNPNKDGYNVVTGDKVVATVLKSDFNGDKEATRDMAAAIARGDEPIPA